MKTKIWFKDAKAKKDYYQMKKNSKIMTKALNPRMHYSSDLDIFAMNWGAKPVDSTIELNLLNEGDLRMDILKDGTIVGIEIDDFSKIMRRFDCDKEPFKSEIDKMIKSKKFKLGKIKKGMSSALKKTPKELNDNL